VHLLALENYTSSGEEFYKYRFKVTSQVISQLQQEQHKLYQHLVVWDGKHHSLKKKGKGKDLAAGLKKKGKEKDLAAGADQDTPIEMKENAMRKYMVCVFCIVCDQKFELALKPGTQLPSVLHTIDKLRTHFESTSTAHDSLKPRKGGTGHAHKLAIAKSSLGGFGFTCGPKHEVEGRDDGSATIKKNSISSSTSTTMSKKSSIVEGGGSNSSSMVAMKKRGGGGGNSGGVDADASQFMCFGYHYNNIFLAQHRCRVRCLPIPPECLATAAKETNSWYAEPDYEFLVGAKTQTGTFRSRTCKRLGLKSEAGALQLTALSQGLCTSCFEICADRNFRKTWCGE
jgi:hypothetical protein